MDLSSPLQDWAAYLNQGGFVMPPLVLATLVLWYALGLRFMTLRRGARGSVRGLLQAHGGGAAQAPKGVVDRAATACVEAMKCATPPLRNYLDDACGPLKDEMARGRVLIRTVVTLAPLAGLLGTVTGMIETFDSLADMSLYSQSGGIAGGISQALFTTQMGLAVAVPGVVLGRWLDRRQQVLELEIERIKDLLSAEGGAKGEAYATTP